MTAPSRQPGPGAHVRFPRTTAVILGGAPVRRTPSTNAGMLTKSSGPRKRGRDRAGAPTTPAASQVQSGTGQTGRRRRCTGTFPRVRQGRPPQPFFFSSLIFQPENLWPPARRPPPSAVPGAHRPSRRPDRHRRGRHLQRQRVPLPRPFCLGHLFTSRDEPSGADSEPPAAGPR